MTGHAADRDTPLREAREHELLVVRCQLGESAAFDELVARWHGPLWRYARQLTGDDERADDLVQDVWIRVLRAIERLRDGSRLRPWLFGIARRAAMDRLRQKYAQPDIRSMDDVEMPEEREVRDLETESQLLNDELERLPVVERDVLALFYLQQLSLTELADVLEVPLGTVKSRLFRARRLLRDRLVERGITS
jgi:RNA polymerase sigma-70 factor (ECF subfamily)